MERDLFIRDLAVLDPQPGDLVYLERRGDRYAWRLVQGDDPRGGDDATPFAWGADPPLPDAWLAYGGRWPASDSVDWDDFVRDLLAELESMADGADRCRWPLDAPYAHGH